MTEKAYKLLAAQENISNNEAKRLIDDGFVYAHNKKIAIARALIPAKTHFKVEWPRPITTLFEDDRLLAIDKPAGQESYDLEKKFGHKLIHRLDKPTSGVILMAKTEAFLAEAIEAFKAQRVKKSYLAAVSGVVAEAFTVDLPVWTEKGTKAISRIDPKRGQPAVTIATPYRVSGKKSLLSVEIPTGRTHQIRVHLAHAGYPIIGDERYGGRPYKRLMLHAHTIALLGYTLSAPEPGEFRHLFDS